MAITRVWLDESEGDCISCGTCEAVCPEVFSIPDKMVVNDGVDFSQYEDGIREAIEACPTSVIKAE
ncbi:ferredoxin [Breznakiella homolactica]|uniref:Ferredoxin n=1 Tax=Breznakiella homolactica TaxID=2798577 RepID=A0A7T7XJJ9_9SPIR|nr:ferredoxin [Breznakiella homolactica]QQO07433.1 ferredoxin [Breznakiella homolactica]